MFSFVSSEAKPGRIGVRQERPDDLMLNVALGLEVS